MQQTQKKAKRSRVKLKHDSQVRGVQVSSNLKIYQQWLKNCLINSDAITHETLSWFIK